MIQNISIFGVTIGQIEKFLVYKFCPALFFICIILFVYGELKNRKTKKIKELKKARKKHGHGIIFGLRRGKEVFSPQNDEGAVGVFSASGTGKTTAVGIPTLRSWKGTSFTIDISGDIYTQCSNMQNKLKFEPESNETIPYNIFGCIDRLTTLEDRYEALEQLAFLIMPNEININENGKYFLDNGRKILTASLIAFYDIQMDFIEICEKIVGSSYKELFSEIDRTNNNLAIMYINSFVGVSEQNVSGCKQSCDDAIKLFATNSKVKRSIHRPNGKEPAIEPQIIENHNIFLVVEDPKLELYSPLLNIITSQLMQYISNRKVNEKSKTILLFLDEFASLKIDSNTILEALRKYRKRKCRMMIMTQSLADLDILYDEKITNAIMSNLKYKVLLGGLGDVRSQKYFADLIGFKDTIKYSKSSNSHDTTQTETEVKEYKIEPAELDRQGKNIAILIHNEADGYLKLKKNYCFK